MQKAFLSFQMERGATVVLRHQYKGNMPWSFDIFPCLPLDVFIAKCTILTRDSCGWIDLYCKALAYQSALKARCSVVSNATGVGKSISQVME